LLARCSDESIRLRFRALLKRTAHEVATRYCYLDYDRDMAMVAEAEVAGHRTMIGVGNLFGEPDGDSAEYAVLVADEWQHRGLGDLLLDRCLRIADGWGLGSVVAHTTRDNSRMLALFLKHGFHILRRSDEDVVVYKVLS
jgi:acetyltransferase